MLCRLLLSLKVQPQGINLRRDGWVETRYPPLNFCAFRGKPIFQVLFTLKHGSYMRIIARKTLIQFWEINPQYADARDSLEAWYHEAKKSNWCSPADVKAKYRSASILKSGRVVFNIAGNKYRLVSLQKSKV